MNQEESAAKDDEFSKKLSRLSASALYSVKRAGDWAQVRHCKRYCKIFVTRDKLAAMYASLVGVRFVFISYEQHCQGDDIPSNCEPFFRHTFVMSK